MTIRPDQIHLLFLGFFKLENGPTDKKNPLMNALQIYTNFIDSGLITTAMVLFMTGTRPSMTYDPKFSRCPKTTGKIRATTN